MRSARYHGLQDVRVETIPEPTIQKPSDALVRVSGVRTFAAEYPEFVEGDQFGEVEYEILAADWR